MPIMKPADFKKLDAAGQRKALTDMFHSLNCGDAGLVSWWIGEYAVDLMDETTPLVQAFDVWYVTTRVYDVDLPNDVAECIADGDDARSWRNMLNRHGLPWRKFTKADFRELGVEA